MGDQLQSTLAWHLSWVDASVIAGVFLLTSLVGLLAGRQATIRGFFLGGRKLPWWAVSASIVATEISAVTLVAVPYVVFKPGGNFTYLQLTLIGSVLARLLVAWLLVPAYFEREIYSPYDFMGDRLGRRAKLVASGLFTLGGVLSQAARVYLTAIVLEVVLHGPLVLVADKLGVSTIAVAIALLGLFAVLWTWWGGVATVVWTDVVLFLALVAGSVVVLFALVAHIDTGWERFWRVGLGAHKLVFFDFATSPAKAYTFWAAAIAASWGGIGAYGIDQMMAQRIFCCRNVREARLAIVASSVGALVTVLVALVGIGLFAYYEARPLSGEALALVERNGEAILPVFVMQSVPDGAKGLVVAGILAAAISSLDGILTALSQTALAVVYLPLRARSLTRRAAARLSAGLATEPVPTTPEEERRSILASRLLVLASGVVVCGLGLWIRHALKKDDTILDLALSMAAYTQGALIAGFALAYLRLDPGGRGFLWSAPLSVMAVFAIAWHGSTSRKLCLAFAIAWLGLWLATQTLPDLSKGRRPSVALRQALALASGLVLLVWVNRYGLVPLDGGSVGGPNLPGGATVEWKSIAFPWYVPIGSTVAFVFACLLSRNDAPEVAREPASGPFAAREQPASVS